MLNTAELLSQGIFATRTVDPNDLTSLYRLIYPIKTEIPLIRLGGDGDGGYLIPDDLKGVVACFSPGTGPTTSFESDLYERSGIKSHLCDPTVAPPSKQPYLKSFLSKFLGPYTTEDTISFQDWIERMQPETKDSELIAQVDIEGSEYLSLLTIPPRYLMKFRILIIELHELYNWANPLFFPLVKSLFTHITRYFSVVHTHPNNNDGEILLQNGLCPRTIEITLYRKDRHTTATYNPTLPHYLDRLNNKSKREIEIPTLWRPHQPFV